MTLVNKAQAKFVDDTRNGLKGESFNCAQAAQLMTELLLTIDHEEAEKEFLEKCLSKAVRTYFSMADDVNDWIYLSQIKGKMSSLKYFKTLNNMASARGVDAFRMIYRILLTEGCAVTDGTKIKLNESAKKFI